MDKIIEEVVVAVGGEGNIEACTNCMTRLRLTLKDDSNVDRQQIKAITGVFGLVEAEEQFQLILGPGKASAAADKMNELHNFG